MKMDVTKGCVTLTVPAGAEYIDIVRLTLYGVATQMGYPFEDIEDMKVAVSEACNNAVLHAYADGQQGEVDIRFIINREGLSICIKDKGRSFDVDEMRSRATSLHNKRLKDIDAGGLGIFMMEALMDRVEVRKNSGTEVILTKLLNRSETMA